MISVNEAFSILEKLSISLKQKKVSLLEAHNCVLAKTLHSPINMPPFRQSNMDGFALALHHASEYTVIGEIKAGDANPIRLNPGEAIKIFTGAAVPDSAQAVVQIEKVLVNGSRLTLKETITLEMNVRLMGSQILKNAVALEKGTFLNAAAIGFLAGLGLTSVMVFEKPSVGIVITGNELVTPGEPLPPGKVYESNAIMLQSALRSAHFDVISTYHVNDNFENTKTVLQKAIGENGVVLVSGGISIGDYDFVGSALKCLNVETLFYKVSQKPGKPLYAGKINHRVIFALPGNPAAALTCFYIHVLPTLQRLSGINAAYRPTVQKHLAHSYTVANSRDQFLKARIDGDNVTILPHQDSSMLDSFAVANALVYFPNGNYAKAEGDKVPVYIL